MKRTAFVFALCAFCAITLHSHLHAQRIINTFETVYTSTIASTETWRVTSTGNLYLDQNQVLTVEGELIINPGGIVNIAPGATIIVGAAGKITMDMYDPYGYALLSIGDAGNLELQTGGYIDMGERAIVRFTDSGLIRINTGAYFNVADNIQIANLQYPNGGTIEIYEQHPFRGAEANFHRMHFEFHTSFDINAGEEFYFKYSGSMTFANPSPDNDINVQGTMYFRSIIGNEVFSFLGTPGAINLNGNARLLADGPLMLYQMPSVNALMGTAINLSNTTGSGTIVAIMRDNTQIVSKGAVILDHAKFHGISTAGWNGIEMIGPMSSISMNYSALTVISQTGNALRLFNSPSSSNSCVDCVFESAYRSMQSGAGILLDSDLPNLNYSRLLLSCSYVGGFGTGVLNHYGYLSTYYTKIANNNVGMYANAASVAAEYICVSENEFTGIMVQDASPRLLGFDLRSSNVIHNMTGPQIMLLGDASVDARWCNIYYETGNTTATLVETYDGSIANVSDNWWGVYPTSPVQFMQYGSSSIVYAPEMTFASLADCSCPQPSMETTTVANIASPAVATISNYPNPFNPSTVIEYTLPHEMPVTLTVYSITGEEVGTLVDETKTAGTHRVTFTAPRNNASGMYLYDLVTPGGSAQGRMLLMK